MATNIVEFFGFDPADRSQAAQSARRTETCPFIASRCTKTLNDGIVSGVCTLKPVTSGPVICCPIRLYADNYMILREVAQASFGGQIELIEGRYASRYRPTPGVTMIAVFGKRWGGELHLPARTDSGKFYLDWILAELTPNGDIGSFVAVEVQSIDTTGNYRAEREAYAIEESYPGKSSAGFNWENVNKRILPQLIYKGHVLRRERLCKKGLFFVCPQPVFGKIKERLGDNLLAYPLQPGTITFMPFDIGPRLADGTPRSLAPKQMLTTTIDQLAAAFSAPTNLPPENVYQMAIQKVLAGQP